MRPPPAPRCAVSTISTRAIPFKHECEQEQHQAELNQSAQMQLPVRLANSFAITAAME